MLCQVKGQENNMAAWKIRDKQMVFFGGGGCKRQPSSVTCHFHCYEFQRFIWTGCRLWKSWTIHCPLFCTFLIIKKALILLPILDSSTSMQFCSCDFMFRSFYILHKHAAFHFPRVQVHQLLIYTPISIIILAGKGEAMITAMTLCIKVQLLLKCLHKVMAVWGK